MIGREYVRDRGKDTDAGFELGLGRFRQRCSSRKLTWSCKSFSSVLMSLWKSVCFWNGPHSEMITSHKMDAPQPTCSERVSAVREADTVRGRHSERGRHSKMQRQTQ